MKSQGFAPNVFVSDFFFFFLCFYFVNLFIILFIMEWKKWGEEEEEEEEEFASANQLENVFIYTFYLRLMYLYLKLYEVTKINCKFGSAFFLPQGLSWFI